MTDFENDLTDATPASAAPSAAQATLRKKVGRLCQFIRGMAVVWALWMVYFVVSFWGDGQKAAGAYGKAFKFDPASIPAANYYAAFGLALLELGLIAALTIAVWKLFSRYLAGAIFSVEAALDLRRIALIGAGAIAYDILMRPVMFGLMTAGHDVGGRNGWLFLPSDLLDVIFVTFLFSLAYIFKTAAELAEEHAQIV